MISHVLQSVSILGRSYTNVDVNSLPGENLVVGGTIRRECVVTSPNWSVYWIKPNGGRLDSRFLTINDLQLSHSGRYTCFAENQSTRQKLNTWFTVNVAQSNSMSRSIVELRVVFVYYCCYFQDQELSYALTQDKMTRVTVTSMSDKP